MGILTSEGKGPYKYNSYMKNALYLVVEAKLQSLGKHCFLPSFANGITNDITSSKTHIIVYLLKIE